MTSTREFHLHNPGDGLPSSRRSHRRIPMYATGLRARRLLPFELLEARGDHRNRWPAKTYRGSAEQLAPPRPDVRRSRTPMLSIHWSSRAGAICSPWRVRTSHHDNIVRAAGLAVGGSIDRMHALYAHRDRVRCGLGLWMYGAVCSSREPYYAYVTPMNTEVAEANT